MIFISHDQQDARPAHQLAEALQSLGGQIWIAPESIRAGEGWVAAINRGLAESSHMLVLLTVAATQSRWVAKEMEVAIALEREGRIRIVPVELEPCTVPPLWASYQKISYQPDSDLDRAKLFTAVGLLEASVVDIDEAPLSDKQQHQIERLNEPDPSTPEDIEGSAAETYYRTGNVLFVTERYEEAIKLYGKAIGLRPDWYKPYMLKGMALEAIGAWQDALDVYKLADQIGGGHLGPERALSLLNLATTCEALGDHRRAALMCERVVAIVEPLGNIGILLSATRRAAAAYRTLGDRPNEIVWLERFLKLERSDSAERAAAERRLADLEC